MSINQSGPDTRTLLLAAVQACEDKKAEDIRILRLDPSESGLTDYFLICHGHNSRQNEAIADEIEYQLKRQFGVYANSVEGRRQGEWVLLDYVDFIVHVFSEEKRGFYGLERLRKTATTISLADLHQEVTARVQSTKAARKPVAKPAAKPTAAPKIAAVKKKTVAKKAVAAKPAAKTAVKKAVKKVAAKKAVKTVAVKKVAAKKAAPKKTAKKTVAKKAVKKAGKKK
jgi:ribosome-associated protein